MAGYHRVKGGHTPTWNKDITMHTITYRRHHDGKEVTFQTEDINEVFKLLVILKDDGYKFEHIYEER